MALTLKVSRFLFAMITYNISDLIRENTNYCKNGEEAHNETRDGRMTKRCCVRLGMPVSCFIRSSFFRLEPSSRSVA